MNLLGCAARFVHAVQIGSAVELQCMAKGAFIPQSALRLLSVAF